MLTFKDGPAKGEFSCWRAPMYLRAVIDSVTGKADVLDQLDDAPTATEKVYVYRQLFGNTSDAIVCVRGRCMNGVGSGTYSHMPKVEGETLRDNATWRKWTLARPEAKK